MKTNLIKDKSFSFALDIIEVYKSLKDDKKEFLLSKQLLRSGTSIGANIEEAIGGVSKRDFLHKISISYKEARETKYWLQLLKESDYIDENSANTLLTKNEELLKILGSIQKTIRSQIEKNHDSNNK